MTIDELGEICGKNGLALSPGQLEQLGGYAAMLLEWNSKINLISRKDEENVFARHILHSLALAFPGVTTLPSTPLRVMDLGSGGGLPGIPFKIARPEDDVLLVDSIGKKIAACRDMIGRLKSMESMNSIESIGLNAVCARAEDLPRKGSQKYDLIISRAVAPLDELVGWVAGLVKKEGVLVSLKGGDLSEEVERTKKVYQVKSVHSAPLALVGYDQFVNEGKKIVRVDFH